MSYRLLTLSAFLTLSFSLQAQVVEIRKNGNNEPRIEMTNPGNNTFIGVGTGSVNLGTFNTAHGYFALYSNTTGEENTATGFHALYNNTEGFWNTATGGEALRSNTTGEENTATGFRALYYNTEGYGNTATGKDALILNTTGHHNTATGKGALFNNNTGDNNTATGLWALLANITGSYNTAAGIQALYYNNNGNNNTAAGAFALYNNTSGDNNTATGFSALSNNNTGIQNTATGMQSLNNNTTGNYNTADGVNALILNFSGSFNTASGVSALRSNTAGNGNTANGDSSLYSNTIGNYNTGLGFKTDVLFNNLNNATAIGYKAKVACSNCMVLGGTGSEAVNVGIGTTSPSEKLEVAGVLKITNDYYGLRHTDGTTSIATYVDGSAGWIGTTSNHPLWFYTNDGASPSMVVDITGDVGIGTSTPGAKLEVQGAVKIVDGTQGANKVLTSDAAGLATWQPGPISKFAMFYGLTSGTGNGGPTDYAATIPAKTSAGTGRVPFPKNGPATGIVRVDASSFTLPAIGTYEITFRVHTTEPGQLQLELNGVDLAEAIAVNMDPSNGGHPIVGNFFITTTSVNSTLALVNPSGNSLSLTVTSADGANTHANSQSITIKQIF